MRSTGTLILSALLFLAFVFIPAVPSLASTTSDDVTPPEIIEITIDKPVLKPGDTGTYTVRLKDENPPTADSYLSWSPQSPQFGWTFETSKKLHDGRIVPGSLGTDASGVTSFQLQFQVLSDAPYGHYDNSSSMTISDSIGNYTFGTAPSFDVNDPLHQIDNEPSIAGKKTVGQTISASINAPGARTTFSWHSQAFGKDEVVGTGAELFLPTKWYWNSIELRATAVWPDGKMLTRRAWTGYLEGIQVDIGKLSFSSPPTVGMKSTAVFTPNPDLPFQLPRTEILISSAPGPDITTSNGAFTPFPADAGKNVRAVLHFELPVGYEATEFPEASAYIRPGSWLTGPPSITGVPEVGHTLKAKAGLWSGEPELFSYQWLRNGKAIEDEISPEYDVKAEDVGTALTVRVTASWTHTADAFSATSAPAAAKKGTLPPLKAQLHGTARVGQRLSASVSGGFDGTRLGYQWLRDGKVITSATKSSYELTAADYTTRISVKVTGSKPGFTTVNATSTGRTIEAGTPAKGTIQVTGTTKVGNTINAKTSGWSSGSTLSYQWLRNGKPIASATKATYQLTAADRSQKVSVKITAHKTGYATVNVSSARHSVSAGTMSRGTVEVSGTAKVGRTLSAKTNRWPSGAKLSYQWLRNGKPIASATRARYKVSSKDRSAKLAVKVGASKPGYTSTSFVTSKQVTAR